MSNESEVRSVLAYAPLLEKVFGRKLAALIIVVSLYFARRPSGFVGLFASFLFVLALVLQTWLKLQD